MTEEAADPITFDRESTPDDAGGVIIAPARRHAPWLTWLACGLCVAIFLGISSERDLETWDTWSKWGCLSPEAVWHGGYWALVTSVFVHVQIWHVAFNVYWLWVLGGSLEKAIGAARWLAFFLLAAIVSSGVQLAVSGETGHGASGVVYGMFGFLWIARRTRPEFENVLRGQTVPVFLLWLVGCIFTTQMGVWNVGNAAHVSGLLFGAGTAACFTLKWWPRLVFAGLCTLILAAIVPLFWCPWSSDWVQLRAYDTHVAGEYQEAVNWYGRAIRLDGNSHWAYSNRGFVNITLGEKDAAMSDLSAAIRLNPHDAQVYLFRAGLFLEMGEVAKAVEDYSASIRLDRNEVAAFMGRAYAYVELGEHAKAIEDYDAAIRLQSNDATAFLGRANAYFAQGDFDRAITDYTEALRLDPKSAVAYYNRGLGYQRLEQSEDAAIDFNRAGELDPEIGRRAAGESQAPAKEF